MQSFNLSHFGGSEVVCESFFAASFVCEEKKKKKKKKKSLSRPPDMGWFMRKVTNPFKRMWSAVHSVVLLRLRPHKRGTDCFALFASPRFFLFSFSCICFVGFSCREEI